MPHDCEIGKQIEEKLREHNTRIAYSFQFDGTTWPTIMVESIVKKRGERPVNVKPVYCPWCGDKL